MSPENQSWSVFELWKEYEGVAMHFNDLLIRLRTQALGGVAAITASTAFLIRTDVSFNWSFIASLFVALAIFWIAIWIIDLKYYNRLLIGSVVAITELEKTSETKSYISKIELSSRVKEAVDNQTHESWSGASWIHLFYSLVLSVLILGLGYAFYKMGYIHFLIRLLYYRTVPCSVPPAVLVAAGA